MAADVKSICDSRRFVGGASVGGGVEVTDNHHGLTRLNTIETIGNGKGPIVFNRVDTIEKHDLERLRLQVYRFLSFFSRRVGSIPTLHLKTFEKLFWTTTRWNNSRKAQ